MYLSPELQPELLSKHLAMQQSDRGLFLGHAVEKYP